MTTIPRRVNLTPHAARLLTADGEELCEHPAPLPERCQENFEHAGCLTLGRQRTAVPLVRVVYREVTDLPAPRSRTWHVVADALTERTDSLDPHDVVRDATGQITGCRSIAVGAALRPKDGS
ncbi:hypothetical protein OIA45_19630 [Streptomyces chartreusis]|uniref:hypothetical protein n=1 Tax=Streptomyces chartreusis TaxID=1969 RepID=UPI003862E750|nr:hypothetical protein OIA45_19630 [Streptomyces chartreusis]